MASSFTTTPKAHYTPLTGVYIHSLDSKGRVIIPAAWRDELGPAFWLAPAEYKRLLALPDGAVNPGSVMRLHINAANRTLIPAALREYADLRAGCEVGFIGRGTKVEILRWQGWQAINQPVMRQPETDPQLLLALGEINPQRRNYSQPPALSAPGWYEKTPVQDMVWEVVSQLDAPYGDILRLRFQEGLSYREIARALDLGRGTMPVRTKTALKRLCERLGLDPQKTSVSTGVGMSVTRKEAG